MTGIETVLQCLVENGTTCKWHKSGYRMSEHNYWETECSNLFQFPNYGPKENQFEWCPYCGNLIEVTE
jgi:hypothetical protein